MKPAIYTNRRPHGLAKDSTRTHLANEGDPLCRTRTTSFASKLQLTTEESKITCARCLWKLGRREREARGE